ncbi:DUF2652 domain-containing protein [Fulvivirga sediminis]|uniref:DUF2652 domain-containing protein n=1 Tax=Fulvivirga sediminis TaxID=2803949 RepID=A0A937K164_9BACT|nr:DUF2652 domain-containing protein [Fulvivirga sediminis]MBL3658299.1 DUF2652 domain-containing protein [Fulvivirga sediminis]
MEKTEQKGVILIPDFSGFTDFVLSHSLHVGGYITEQLLNTIIDNNIMAFEISEIEGDAVLFYKYGNPSDISSIIQQAIKMKEAFSKCLEDLHQQLKTKIALSLKFIVHYGTFSEYVIGKFKKLYGATVVESHRLLKYHYVKNQSYILFSKEYLRAVENESSKIIRFNRKTRIDSGDACVYNSPVGLIKYI